MKKRYLLLFLSLLCFMGCDKNVSRETYNPENIYSQLMLVSECYYNANGTATIELINCNGFTYNYINIDQDIEKGDYASVTFYDNNTDYIFDDIILNIKYDRPDLLFQYENRGYI